MHIYMEMSQGNSLCSSFFFFYKIKEQEGRTGPVGRRRGWGGKEMV
jgi:hypothetical protein